MHKLASELGSDEQGRIDMMSRLCTASGHQLVTCPLAKGTLVT